MEAPPKAYLDKETGNRVLPKDMSQWTVAEKIQYEWHDKYKQVEYNLYKDFHRVVLNDDGIPMIKKTAFRMPGYRKVLGKKTVEYEIDNDIHGQEER